MKLEIDDHICDTQRFLKLRSLLGVSTEEALGTLTYMWLITRRSSFVGSRDLHDFVVLMPDMDVLYALLETGYIFRKSGPFYEVEGNADWIAMIEQKRSAGRLKAGKTKMVMKADYEQLVKAAAAAKIVRPACRSPILPLMAAVEKKKPHRMTPIQAANAACWEAYCDAFVERWEVEPTRNAMVNSKLAQFVQRVGHDDAPHIITFFVRHNDNRYVANMHPIGFALRDAESLRAQWMRGTPITRQQVGQMERDYAMAEQIARIQSGKL